MTGNATKMKQLGLLFNRITSITKPRRLGKFIAAATVVLSTTQTYAAQVQPPKNIIYVISDGMGIDYTTAYRFYTDDRSTEKVETTIFDEMFIGISSTHSDGTQEHKKRKSYVTDSAASATALSTGIKTYNQAVAIDTDDQPQQTLMQYAKKSGKKTALVVTSQINHATPASFVAHNTYRYNYNDIADQFYDNRINGQFIADLMFGGGQKYFIRDDRNIADQFVKSGYQYIDSYEHLNDFNRLPALGLFADKGLGYAIDNRQHKHRLKHMVDKALTLLQQNNDGFFMLVESSLVDWCGHDNDIACAMHEMDGLDATMERLKIFVDNNPDTLVILTSDHDTGGLSIGANNKYQWYPEKVKTIRHSINFFTQELLKNADLPIKILWQNHIKIDIDKQQLAIIAQARQSALETIKKNRNLEEAAINEVISDQRVEIARTISKIIADNTLTGWTSFNHTGGDVNVYAYGQGKELFSGFQDNVDIAEKLFKLLGRADKSN